MILRVEFPDGRYDGAMCLRRQRTISPLRAMASEPTKLQSSSGVNAS